MDKAVVLHLASLERWQIANVAFCAGWSLSASCGSTPSSEVVLANFPVVALAADSPEEILAAVDSAKQLGIKIVEYPLLAFDFYNEDLEMHSTTSVLELAAVAAFGRQSDLDQVFKRFRLTH